MHEGHNEAPPAPTLLRQMSPGPGSTNKIGRMKSLDVATCMATVKNEVPVSVLPGKIEDSEELRQDFPMLSNGSLPLRRKLLFGLPSCGWFALKYMKVSFMKIFYTDDYPQASLGYIALFGILAVLIDAFTDPLMASITDNSRPKFLGRRRPFVLCGAILSIAVFPMSYMPLVPAGVAASLWYGVFHIATKLIDTVLWVPLEGWGAEMTPCCKERSQLWAYRELFLVVGILMGAVAPGFLSTLGGSDCLEDARDGCLAFPLLAFLFASMLLVSCMILVILGRERPNDRLPAPPPKKEWHDQGIVPSLISTWLNKPFKCLIVTEISEALGSYMPYAVLPYFTRVVIGDACMKPSQSFSLLAAVNLTSRLLSLPIWVWVSNRVGKFKTFYWFNFLLAGSHLLFILVGRDDGDCVQIYMAAGLAAVWGMVMSGSMFMKSLMSDIADYDEFLTGSRREAQYLMTVEFLPKFLEVPAEALPILLMAWFGYQRPSTGGAPSPEQPIAVVWLLRLCFSLVPGVFIFCGGLVLNKYPKAARDEQAHASLMAAIRDCHRQGLPAEDPWNPGHILSPPPREVPNRGLLSHFFPAELREAVGTLESAGQEVNYAALRKSPLRWILAGLASMVLGMILMVLGWDDLNDELGASTSPLGLILIGVAILIVWFHGTRLRAAQELQRIMVPQRDIVAQYNLLCRFTGDSLIQEGVWADGSEAAICERSNTLAASLETVGRH